jgi:hypothetical protein
MNPWWTDQQAGLVGGIAGSLLGVLGGVFGTVAGICAPRGKAKGFVYGLAITMIITGVVCLVTGIVALAMGQPYGVYYPLLLIGALSAGLMGGLFPVIRMRYREADNRRFEAEELRRS